MKKVLLATAAFVAMAVPAQAKVIEAPLSKTEAITTKMPKNWRTWIRIGRCEQPGRGAWGINWSHPGPTYQGGLGFYSGTWKSFKLRGYPSNAGKATWKQQMIVANRVAYSVGFSAWGCY
jgi:hypothetical protein